MLTDFDFRRKGFLYLLILMLLVHISALLIKFQFAPQDVAENKSTPLKVRVLRDLEARKQIVRSEDSPNQEKKENAYLSDKDRSFDRQTRARKVDVFQNAAKGNASINSPSSQKSAKTSKRPTKNLKLSDLAASPGSPNPFAKAAREYAAAKKGVKQGNEISRGISSTNDHVEKIPLGDLTHLNTVEFKYYGFYHRIRQKLEQFWGRSIQEKAEELFQNGRRVASDEELLTSLRVVMNAKGKIIDVEVMGSSGIKEFDDAAIESFNEAGPFPFPPKDLIVDGRVIIEWGFVVQS